MTPRHLGRANVELARVTAAGILVGLLSILGGLVLVVVGSAGSASASSTISAVDCQAFNGGNYLATVTGSSISVVLNSDCGNSPSDPYWFLVYTASNDLAHPQPTASAGCTSGEANSYCSYPDPSDFPEYLETSVELTTSDSGTATLPSGCWEVDVVHDVTGGSPPAYLANEFSINQNTDFDWGQLGGPAGGCLSTAGTTTTTTTVPTTTTTTLTGSSTTTTTTLPTTTTTALTGGSTTTTGTVPPGTTTTVTTSVPPVVPPLVVTPPTTTTTVAPTTTAAPTTTTPHTRAATGTTTTTVAPTTTARATTTTTPHTRARKSTSTTTTSVTTTTTVAPTTTARATVAPTTTLPPTSSATPTTVPGPTPQSLAYTGSDSISELGLALGLLCGGAGLVGLSLRKRRNL